MYSYVVTVIESATAAIISWTGLIGYWELIDVANSKIKNGHVNKMSDKYGNAHKYNDNEWHIYFVNECTSLSMWITNELKIKLLGTEFFAGSSEQKQSLYTVLRTTSMWIYQLTSCLSFRFSPCKFFSI